MGSLTDHDPGYRQAANLAFFHVLSKILKVFSKDLAMICGLRAYIYDFLCQRLSLMLEFALLPSPCLRFPFTIAPPLLIEILIYSREL